MTDQLLTKDEKVLYTTGISKRYLTVSMVVGIVLSLIFAFLIALAINGLQYRGGGTVAYSQGETINLPTFTYVSGEFIGGIIAVLLTVVIVIYYGFYLPMTTKVTFTDQRIIAKFGWLSTKVISIKYDRITDVAVYQTLAEKIFYGTGNLAINTAGGDHNELVIKSIDEPYKLKQIVQEQMGNA